MAWPDERLDDLGGRMDAGFERVDSEIAELRTEMHQGFRGVREEMQQGLDALRADSKSDMSVLRADSKSDMNALRADLNGRLEQMDGRLDRMYGVMVGLSVALVTGLFGIVGAILATGFGG